MTGTDTEGTVTLREFVEGNHRLISVLGIFVALSAFSGGLRPAKLGLTLASVFLAMAILILLELWIAFPRGRAAKRLEYFGLGVLVTMFLVCAYWLMAFRQIWPGVLMLPILAALVAACLALMKRPRLAGLISRVLSKTGRAGAAVWIVLSIVLIFALLYVSARLEHIAEPVVYKALKLLFDAPQRPGTP